MAGGRPSKYETPEELEKAIAEYFAGCTTRLPTTAGLALHLGYADRQSLYDQRGRSEEFSCAIKRALLSIEDRHEANLGTSGSPAGSIFWLKNHQWADKQEVGLTGANGGPIQTQSLSLEEAEEFKRRFNELHPTLAKPKSE